MKAIRRFTLFAVVLLTTLAVVIVVGVLANGQVRAQTATPQSGEMQELAQEPEQPQRVIHVTGVGSISAQPDQAVVVFGVQTEAESAAEALEENNILMQEVISATLDAGVAEDDLQTQQLRLEPVYSQVTDTTTGDLNLTGYRARNTINVTVQEVLALGDLLDAAVEAGANTIDSIRFEISERDALLADAREAAVDDARAKAEQLADLTGAELGQVLTISEFGMVPPPDPFAVQDTVAVGGAVPIEPGTQTIEARVQISWQLE